MYNVTLINLTADARSVAALAHVEQRDLAAEALGTLLRNFCEIDPLENAVTDAEIRVQVRRESYLIRTQQKKLILSDVNNRELMAQILTVEQVMRELDGTASSARHEAISLARAEAAPAETETAAVPVGAGPAAPAGPRLPVLVVTAGLLLAAIFYLAEPFAAAVAPAGFVAVEPTELAGLSAALNGVYLTGSEPGQHGIVISGPEELKLFELGAVAAPRVVYATYRLGRTGPKLCLATDQPGGVIEVTADGTLVYGGEDYRRIP